MAALLLVPVVGNGTSSDPFRAETHGLSAASVIPNRPEGRPKFDIALILASAEDYSALDNDANALRVADLADLDVAVEELDADKRAYSDRAAQQRNVNVSGLVRDVVRAIGRALEPEFDENLWVR